MSVAATFIMPFLTRLGWNFKFKSYYSSPVRFSFELDTSHVNSIFRLDFPNLAFSPTWHLPIKLSGTHADSTRGLEAFFWTNNTFRKSKAFLQHIAPISHPLGQKFLNDLRDIWKFYLHSPFLNSVRTTLSHQFPAMYLHPKPLCGPWWHSRCLASHAQWQK